jgi:hypothetical protein
MTLNPHPALTGFTREAARQRLQQRVNQERVIIPNRAVDTLSSRLGESVRRQVACIESIIERLELINETSATDVAEVPTEGPNLAIGTASPVPSSLEILTLKPTIYGVGIDLKEVGRRIKRRFQRGDKSS